MAETATSINVGSRDELCRLSYEHIFKSQLKRDKKGDPVLDDDGNKIREFGAQVRIPKEHKKTVAKVEAAIEAAGLEAFGDKWKALKKSKNTKFGLRDGDDEAEIKEDETLKGFWFFNAKSWSKPGVVGARKNAAGKFDQLQEGSVKSGDWGKFAITFKGFDKDGGIGVRAQLNNFQFLKEGDPLGNKRSAEQDFDDEEGFDDDSDDAGDEGSVL